MWKFIIFTLFLLCCCEEICSFKILVIITPHSTSHYIVGRGIADILHERGHEITMVSSILNNKPTFREIHVPELADFEENHPQKLNLNNSQEFSVIDGMLQLSTFMPKTADLLYSNRDVQKLINDKNEMFDLLIFDHFLNDALVALGAHFQCPVIAISPSAMLSWLAISTRNPLAPETTPDIFQHTTNNMNLIQRIKNVLFLGFQELLSYIIQNPLHETIYKKHFPELSSRVSFSEIQSNISAVFINSHPSLSAARPLLPNAIEIGGFHIKEAKSLPADLQAIMDSAEHGVIYFNMGSILKSAEMSLELQNIILKVFSKLNQTILWKFEGDLPDKPSNVIIRKWMPQTSILAHKKTKIFISHGGSLSKTEAIHYGVPLLAIPIFGDQHHNAIELAEKGNGIMLDFENTTENSLSWALNEMLTNPKYSDVAKETQKTYHDRPMKPKDLIIFYSEHIIRTGGAPHLSPPKLSRISALLLDVFTVLMVIPTVIILSFSSLCVKYCMKTKNNKLKVQ